MPPAVLLVHPTAAAGPSVGGNTHPDLQEGDAPVSGKPEEDWSIAESNR